MCSRLTLFRLASGHETRHFRTTRPAFLKRKNRIAGLPFPSSGKNPTRPFPAGRHATSRKSLPRAITSYEGGKSLFSLPPRFQDQSPSLPAGKRAAAEPGSFAFGICRLFRHLRRSAFAGQYRLSRPFPAGKTKQERQDVCLKSGEKGFPETERLAQIMPNRAKR